MNNCYFDNIVNFVWSFRTNSSLRYDEVANRCLDMLTFSYEFLPERFPTALVNAINSGLLTTHELTRYQLYMIPLIDHLTKKTNQLFVECVYDRCEWGEWFQMCSETHRLTRRYDEAEKHNFKFNKFMRKFSGKDVLKYVANRLNEAYKDLSDAPYVWCNLEEAEMGWMSAVVGYVKNVSVRVIKEYDLWEIFFKITTNSKTYDIPARRLYFIEGSELSRLDEDEIDLSDLAPDNDINIDFAMTYDLEDWAGITDELSPAGDIPFHVEAFLDECCLGSVCRVSEDGFFLFEENIESVVVEVEDDENEFKFVLKINDKKVELEYLEIEVIE